MSSSLTIRWEYWLQEQGGTQDDPIMKRGYTRLDALEDRIKRLKTEHGHNLLSITVEQQVYSSFSGDCKLGGK